MGSSIIIWGVIGGNRQPPGSRELMPMLMMGTDRPAVPDVRAQRPVIGGNAVGGLGTAWTAHTALEADVAPDVVYTQSPYCMRHGSSDYDQYPRGAVAACDPEA